MLHQHTPQYGESCAYDRNTERTLMNEGDWIRQVIEFRSLVTTYVFGRFWVQISVWKLVFFGRHCVIFQSSCRQLTVIYFVLMVHQPLVGQGVLIIETSQSHSDTPQSVGFLWTSDQPIPETSTWQHTTLTRDKYPCHRRVSNRHSQQASGLKPMP